MHGQVSVGSGYILLHVIFLHQLLRPGMLVPHCFSECMSRDQCTVAHASVCHMHMLVCHMINVALICVCHMLSVAHVCVCKVVYI